MNKIHVGEFIIGDDEKKAIMDVLDSGRLSEGPRVKQFEKEWADFIGTKYSVLVNSGTSAVIAGLAALKYRDKIADKKKVITTPLTYIATSNAVVLSNLEPAYVDIDKKTFNITPENVREYLETVKDPEEHSILLPVHLMGFPCDMEGLNKVAKDFNLSVFEDAAEAHGSYVNSKKAGAMSDLSAFSFYIAHNVQVGEMGAINTDDHEIVRLVRKIKANGRACDCVSCVRAQSECVKMKANAHVKDFDPRFMHDMIGYNFKTIEFQAALGLVQMQKVDWILKTRQDNVKYLNDGLKDLKDKMNLPEHSEKISYLAYPLLMNENSGKTRSEVCQALERLGVETRPLFNSIPTQQPSFDRFRKDYEGKVPNAEYVGNNGFYIGCHQFLKKEDLDYIIETFHKVLK